jgi:hypothetical protein
MKIVFLILLLQGCCTNVKPTLDINADVRVDTKGIVLYKYSTSTSTFRTGTFAIIGFKANF